MISFLRLTSQEVPVFGWQSHFSYFEIKEVVSSTSGVYASTEQALYFIDQQDNSVNLLNRIRGLSDIGIGAISFDDSNNILAIGYQNGNLDLIRDNQLDNITTILDAPNVDEKSFLRLKLIDNELWAGLSFGMVRYNLEQNEFSETYQNIGVNGQRVAINDFIINGDSIIAASDDGILSVSLSDETNRQDFNFWKRQLVGLSFSQLISFEKTLYAALENDLFKQNEGKWEFLTSFDDPISSFYSGSAGDYIVTSSQVYRLVSDIPELLLSAKTEWGNLLSITEHNNELLIGSSEGGLLVFSSLADIPQAIIPAGPASDQLTSQADSVGIQVWASGSQLSSYVPRQSSWSILPMIDSNNQPIQSITDISLSNRQRIISNYIKGPYIQSDDQFLSLAEEVSPNNPLKKDNNSYNISAIEVLNGQLWIVQKEVDQALSSWDSTTDEWQVYDLSHPLRNYINDLFISDNGDKWLPIDRDRGGGMLVYDEEEGRSRYLNTNGGQGGLPGREVTDIKQDQDRFIWITTNEGVCFFPNPESILMGNSLSANIPIFDGSLLLRDEYLTSIAIDPANRKWIATQDNGVWLFSETGEELIQHFTKENSPLPSNQVNKVSLDAQTGQVFFTTDKGIASFRSDATEGSDTHENVRIYPNPVSPNFTGFVVIEGLVNNALVKLTDVSGKLVKEIQANGSTATWNVRDLRGTKVQTGVYLVFSSNKDGSETYIGKIVVI